MPDQDYGELPIPEAAKFAMALYMFNELDASKTARTESSKVFEQILRFYEQLDVPEKKDTPFEGAANIMLPIIPTYTEQVHARLFDTLYGQADPYQPNPTREELYKFAKAVRKWLTWADRNELNTEQVDYSAILELLKLGTMVEKVVYERIDETLYTYNATLKKYEPVIERQKDNPEFVHVSIEDFFWQMHARNIEESEWRAQRIRLSWNEVKLRQQDGRFSAKAVEQVRTWYTTQRTDANEAVGSTIGIEPTSMYEFEFFEVWFRYPIKFEDGVDSAPIDEQGNINNSAADIPVKLTGVLHKDARVWMSLKHNTFPLGLDPFEVTPFVGREQQVLGIGIGHMGLPFQIETTAMHNQRLDAGTVANATGYVYRADSRIPSELTLRPGRGIPADDPEKDIKPFKLGGASPETLENERHTLQLLQERIGVRDFAIDEAALAKAPATTTLAMMAERGRRLDNVLRNIRRFKRRMILKAILLYKQYYPRAKLVELFGPEDGQLLEAFLDLPAQTIWDGMGIEVSATTSAQSRELDRQSKMALFNVLLGYYDKYVGYVSGAAQPNMPPELQQVLIRMGEGLSTFMEELLESFSIKNKRDYTIDLKAIAAAAQQQQQQQLAAGTPVQNAGVQTPPGAGATADAAPVA